MKDFVQLREATSVCLAWNKTLVVPGMVVNRHFLYTDEKKKRALL